MKIYSYISLSIIFCLLKDSLVSGKALIFNQAAGTTGVLLCNGMPEERVRIYLFDYDRDSFNDQLSDVFSDKEGFFKIEGYETEFFPVEPFIRILHNCNLKGELKEKCYYRYEYKIPRRYVSWGKKPKVYHSSGTIELSSAKTSEMICGP